MNFLAASCGVSQTSRNEASFGEYNPKRFKRPYGWDRTAFFSRNADYYPVSSDAAINTVSFPRRGITGAVGFMRVAEEA